MMGKFGDDPVAEALYNMAGDSGQDDTCGDSSEGPGWYALFLNVRRDLEELGLADDFLNDHYILEEDPFGFVACFSYSDEIEAREAFELLRDELGDWA